MTRTAAFLWDAHLPAREKQSFTALPLKRDPEMQARKGKKPSFQPPYNHCRAPVVSTQLLRPALPPALFFSLGQVVDLLLGA